MELIGRVSLAHVELGLPLGEASAATLSGATASAFSGVVVKVLEEAEERGEGSLGRVKVSLEECHFASWCCCEWS